MENTPAILTGIVGLVMMVWLIVVGIAWLVFPFIVVSKANKMIKQQAAMEHQLQVIAWNLEKQNRQAGVDQSQPQ